MRKQHKNLFDVSLLLGTFTVFCDPQDALQLINGLPWHPLNFLEVTANPGLNATRWLHSYL